MPPRGGPLDDDARTAIEASRLRSQLRQAGPLETRREGIVLLDPERLLGEAYPGEAGANVPLG